MKIGSQVALDKIIAVDPLTLQQLDALDWARKFMNDYERRIGQKNKRLGIQVGHASPVDRELET